MKSRTLSGGIILLVIFGSLFINYQLFSIVMGGCCLIGYRELFNIKYSDNSNIDTIKYIGYIFLLMICLDGIFFKVNNNIKVIIPMLFLTIPIVFYNNGKKYNINDSLYIMGIIYFLGFAFNNIILLSKLDIFKCIYIFLIAFVTDTYAYIGGMLIGKHKLTEISPKKTIEGSIVGSFVGCGIGSLFYYVTIGGINVIAIIVISLVLTFISQIGDLVFSSIKRYFNKKDYSNFIPGHGGILDRFDSVIFVSLCYMVFFSIL